MRWDIARGPQPEGDGWEPFAVVGEEIWWRRAGEPPAISTQLLTPRELARFLRVDVATLRRLVTAGKLPRPIRLGRGIRWHLTDVLTHLKTLPYRASRLELS